MFFSLVWRSGLPSSRVLAAGRDRTRLRQDPLGSRRLPAVEPPPDQSHAVDSEIVELGFFQHGIRYDIFLPYHCTLYPYTNMLAMRRAPSACLPLLSDVDKTVSLSSLILGPGSSECPW